jgi:hypothetical protein
MTTQIIFTPTSALQLLDKLHRSGMPYFFVFLKKKISNTVKCTLFFLVLGFKNSPNTEGVLEKKFIPKLLNKGEKIS